MTRPSLDGALERKAVGVEPAITLIAAYHASARDELVKRIDRRDSALFLYLAAVATLLTVMLPELRTQGGALLVIPVLGLAASLVHSQHNTVIGALGVYIGLELQRKADELIPGGAKSWDASTTLSTLRGHIGSRLWASLVMLVVPSALAIPLATQALDMSGVSVALIVGASLCPVASVALLMRAEFKRRQFSTRIRTALSGAQ